VNLLIPAFVLISTALWQLWYFDFIAKTHNQKFAAILQAEAHELRSPSVLNLGSITNPFNVSAVYPRFLPRLDYGFDGGGYRNPISNICTAIAEIDPDLITHEEVFKCGSN